MGDKNQVLNQVIKLLPERGLIIVDGNNTFSGNEDILLELEKMGIVRLDRTVPGPVIVAAQLTEYGRLIKERGGL